LRIVRRHLGPAGGWFVRDQVVGKVPMLCGYSIDAATVENGRVRLSLRGGDGERRDVTTDHVIAATGYRVRLSRLKFLDRALAAQVAVEDESPRLSANFESTVPGLYFVGVAAAFSFGPLMRFALGARYTARRVAAHLYRARSRRTTEALPDAVTS
jgi:thioredoxin reductase